MPLAEECPASRQDQERGSEEEKTKIEERSTDKIPANEAKRTSATSRLPQHRLKNRKMHEMHKIKLINILNRLTKRRQDAKIDALINYITSDITDDDITDPDITGEIKSPDVH